MPKRILFRFGLRPLFVLMLLSCFVALAIKVRHVSNDDDGLPTITLPMEVGKWDASLVSAQTFDAADDNLSVVAAKYRHALDDSEVIVIFAAGPPRHVAVHSAMCGCYSAEFKIAEMGEIFQERFGTVQAAHEFRTAPVSFVGWPPEERAYFRWAYTFGDNWSSPKSTEDVSRYYFSERRLLYKLYMLSNCKLDKDLFNGFVDEILKELDDEIVTN